MWDGDFFKQVGDACGGFVMVDEYSSNGRKLQWVRILVRSKDFFPSSVRVVAGDLCFSIPLWWELYPRVAVVQSRRLQQQKVGDEVGAASCMMVKSGLGVSLIGKWGRMRVTLPWAGSTGDVRQPTFSELLQKVGAVGSAYEEAGPDWPGSKVEEWPKLLETHAGRSGLGLDEMGWANKKGMLGIDEECRALNKGDLGQPSSEVGFKCGTTPSSSGARFGSQGERDLFPHFGDSSHSNVVNEGEVCALSEERDLVTACIVIVDEALMEQASRFRGPFVPSSTFLGRVKLSSSSTPLSLASLWLDEACSMGG